MKTDTSKRNKLIEEGYCLIPKVLPNDLLERVRQASTRLLDELSISKRGLQC